MPEKGWQRRFDDPIPLPRGRELVTLKDAGTYLRDLPIVVLLRIATSNRAGDPYTGCRAVGLMSGCTAGNRFDCFRRAVRTFYVPAWTGVRLRRRLWRD